MRTDGFISDVDRDVGDVGDGEDPTSVIGVMILDDVGIGIGIRVLDVSGAMAAKLLPPQWKLTGVASDGDVGRVDGMSWVGLCVRDTDGEADRDSDSN